MLSGTSLATLVVAGGMLSPMLVDEAQAGCTRISDVADTPEVRYCNNFNSKGYTLNSQLDRDIEMYVAWDSTKHAGYSWDDGTFIRQEGKSASVKVLIVGSNVGAPIENVYENANIDNLFPLADNNLKVAFTSDGKDDLVGSDHAFEVEANGGDVTLRTLGEVYFRTSGKGRDGINFNTKGGDALVVTGAGFDVVEDGIDIGTKGGDALVASLGDIVAGGSGIKIETSNGDAFAYVGGDSEISVKGDGLSLKAGNGISGVWVDNTVDAGLSAIRASGSEVYAIVGKDGSVSGSGSSPTNAVVNLNGRDSNVFVNLGIVASNASEILAEQSNDMALEIARGSASVYNFGTITGRFDGTDESDEFVNGDTWQFTGETRFGEPDEGTDEDVLRNIAFETKDDGDRFGVIENAFDADTMETAQYRDLETFYNAGIITLQDQEWGDTFNRDRAYTTGDFIGEGGLIAIDADLGEQLDADRFIIGGDVSGTTFVDIRNIASGPLHFSAEGIPVIEIGGVVNAETSFELLGGRIDAGLFSYDLYQTGDMSERYDDNLDDRWSLATEGLVDGGPTINSMWVLAATLDAEAYQLPVLAYGAQNLWQASAGLWGDRTADLRTAFGTGFGGGGADMIVDQAAPAAPGLLGGFWGRAFGGTLERDFANSADLPGGGTASFDDSFRQNYYGFVGGVDTVHALSANSAVVYGLLAGYTGSDLEFDLSGGDADYQQGSIGAYATYIDGGFYADMLAKADFGKLEYSADGDSGESDYTSLGVSVDAGYRFNFGSSWFFEPKATLAYVNTSFDDLDILGTGVAFEDGESLRGRLGARVGTTIDKGGNLITPYLEASVWNEFSGDYSATLAAIDGPSVGYDAGGTYGEVVAGVDFVNVGAGWTAFGKGALQFGDDDMLGFSGNLGLRKSW